MCPDPPPSPRVRLLLDDDLVETAVFLCATGRRDLAPPDVRRFHVARENAYALLDPEERQEAFARAHLTFFQEWGLEDRLHRILARFPLFPATLEGCAFRLARTASEEGAELYVNAAAAQNAIVALRPERLAAEGALEPFLHHELQHVHDMLDPAFGYRSDLPAVGLTASRERIVRHRYRLLWDVVIDARLLRRGLTTVATRDGRRTEFLRAFGFVPGADARFDSLWATDSPTHAILMDWALDPRGLEQAHAPMPGGPCPLCGFPTFAWADVHALPHTARERIDRDFPSWDPAEGLCARCFEIYAATAGLALPPTVVV